MCWLLVSVDLRDGMKRGCVFTGECRRKAFRGLMRSGSGSQMRPELALSFKGGKKTVREYCTFLYEFAVRSQVQQKLKHQELKFKEQGDKAMEKEYAQIYGIVMELLDNMVEILGEETVNRQDFRQLLETGLNQAKVALIPPSMDQVLVGDMERTRLKDIRALFLWE